MTSLAEMVSKVKSGYDITKEEAMLLMNENLQELLEKADEIRTHFCNDTFEFSSIINGKSGRDNEVYNYYLESKYYDADVAQDEFLNTDILLEDALHYACEGVKNYSIVTFGERLNEDELEELCKTYERLHDDLTINLCASHGLLKEDELVKLKKAGVKCYHNNLESSRKFFESVSATHIYDEKITTLNTAKKVGLEVCSGGIFGIGENMEDRIDMAFELRELNIDSISLSLFNAKNAAQEEQYITEEEFLRAVAIVRFINPTKIIQLAGGRSQLEGYGVNTFKAGINGTVTKDLVTYCGNNVAKDREVVTELGFVIN